MAKLHRTGGTPGVAPGPGGTRGDLAAAPAPRPPATGAALHVSGRGVVVAPALHRRVELGVAKVGRLLPKIAEARVVLSRERYRTLAEITLHAKGATIHAEATGGDLQTAVDLALASLTQQARRRKDRIRERKPRAARRRLAGVEPAGLSGEAAAGRPAPDVLVRRVDAPPRALAEALEDLRRQSEPVVVFTDARSRVIKVLWRRADGGFELVEPAR